MICPKCKKELPDNTIRCPECGLRLNIICPNCKTVNQFGTLNCKSCSKELLKLCSVCKSYNLPNAKECRKCHHSFENNEIKSSETHNEINIVKPINTKSNNYSMPRLKSAYSYESVLSGLNEDETDEKVFNIDNTDEQNNKIDFNEVLENINNDSNYNVTIQDTNNTNEDTQNSIEEEVIKQNAEVPKEISDFNDEYIEDEDFQKIEIQTKTVKNIVNTIKNSITKHIIAVNGNEGSGKSAVVKQINNYLAKDGYICLYGSLTPLLQITSFGFFQDAFLRIMGFPPFIKSKDAFLRDFKRSNFAKLFRNLDNKELAVFLNIFYPSLNDEFGNIIENRNAVFNVLEKVITSFLSSSNIVITIDNFELLDGASYDFIVHLLKKGYFNNRLKLLVAYQENRPIQSYFDITEADENIFETILIKKIGPFDMINSLKRSIGIDFSKLLPKDFLDELLMKSNGNAIRMEQEAALLIDTNYITIEDGNVVLKEENKPDLSPDTFSELIKLRVNALSPVNKNILFMAAIMGYRFSTSILFSALGIPYAKAQFVLDFFAKELYINYVDNYTCEFKSLTLWKIIYQEAKSDSLYADNSKKLYSILKNLILSSNLQKLISCKEALNKEEEFNIWQNTLKITAKLGDTNLYVIAQKQCLKLLDEVKFENSDEIRALIYEEAGKLLCEKSPQEAITYLSNILDMYIKEANTKKIVDISGYFIKSCYLTGNYFGVSEAVDAVIAAITGNEKNISNMEISLIKTRKLPALLNIGNSEQIINLVKEDILPDLKAAIHMPNIDSDYKVLIMNAILSSYVILAKAYALQGNKEVLHVCGKLRELIDKYCYNTMYYTTQTDILEALGYSIIGEINKSNEKLNIICNQYSMAKMETDLLAQWNIINVINRVLSGQTDNLKTDLFELATFTNNINEHSLKNIVKLILGYILKEEGNKAKALEIFNEEITYFAKEKIAVGALLSWSLIVQIIMSMGDYDKALDTAVKSLEIAQSPKINNYLFTVYFEKYIAEIYLIKQDYIAAKMYLEKAMMIAKQYDLRYQIVELYISYAKFMEEYMQSNNQYPDEDVKTAYEMYSKAVTIAKELKLSNLTEKAVKAKASFKVFCQLNSISLQ